jgi:glycosyltransferase involved in cell wall biosynthesis
VWAQFAAYHVDRCEAVARRLAGRAEVIAVEIASSSRTYAWEPSADTAGARKVTLFPGMVYEAIPLMRRVFALWWAIKDCDWAMIGVSYADPTIVLLAPLLRMSGVRLIVFSESKHDDRPRRSLLEFVKRAGLSLYHGAIVGGPRHIAYFRQLGFRRRPLLPGYDGVGLDRVRREAGGVLAPDGAAFEDRSFVFVGRFVDKKNLPRLIEAYAIYAREAGSAARRLVLAGSGEEEAMLRRRIAELGLADLVELPGFLPAQDVSRLLSQALALVLVSREEQWGLVVNEALALGLPVVVSKEVGSRDLLVADGVNGRVVESASPEQIAEALACIAADEDRWRQMVGASHERAWLGDADRLADAVEAMVFPGNAEAAKRLAAMAGQPA